MVLDTIHFSESHTAEHIAAELRAIAEHWAIKTKILCIITDNAANCVAASRILTWRHLPCYAHTLNLIVRDGLNSERQVISIQQKCKSVVAYFNHSVTATTKLSEIQQQLKLPEKKLISDVETRWNSTFYMFERIIELNDAVTTTLCLSDKTDLILSSQEIAIMKEVV